MLRGLWNRLRSWPIWAQFVLGFVVLGLIGSALSTRSSDTAASPPPSGPVETNTPEVLGDEPVLVPDVGGLMLDQARASLQQLGFEVVIQRVSSTQIAGTVLGQDPAPGAPANGSSITLMVSVGAPKVPTVVGLQLAAARTKLKHAGFKVAVREEASGRPAGTVLSQSPRAGTASQPGAVVKLVVAKPRTPSGRTGGNCDPSYPTVCIPPPPPDLDCSDVRYTNFTVVGSDPQGFDGDGDGVGCET